MGQGLRCHKIFFIINPRAGGGKAASWWQNALPALNRLEVDFFWQYSAGGAQTSRQVREAVQQGQATAVMSIGGDGHMHDTLNGIIENDTLIKPELVFGVCPAGTGCDFARMIYPHGKGSGVDSFTRLLLEGVARRVDVGSAVFHTAAGEPAQAYFLNGSDIGMGAETCRRVNAEGGWLKRRLRSGQTIFLLAAIQTLFSYKYCPVSVQADGECLDGQYVIAAVGNGRFMGGNMCFFPQAQLDDGLLDLFLAAQMPKPKILRLFSKVYDGTVLQVAEVSYRQVKSVIIQPEQPLHVELDGELPGFSPLSVRVLPQLLPLLQFDN